MRLYLVRHAQACPKSQDKTRPLTPTGARDAQAIGQCLCLLDVEATAIWHSRKARSIVVERHEGSLSRLAPARRHEGKAPAVTGVELADGRIIHCRAAIVTTGTFLRGLMHTGEKKSTGGRFGEAAANHLSDSLRELGLELGRLKTGTPPRLHRD